MLPNAASVALVRKHELLMIQRARAPMEGLGLYAFALRPVRVLQVQKYRLQVFATEGFEGEIVPNPEEIRAWRWARAEELHSIRTTIDLGEVVEAVFRMFDRS